MRRQQASAVALSVGLLIALATTSWAHDFWISRGALKNAAGEWCCGAGDCFVLQNVRESVSGYLLNSGEFVPISEAQPSPDGAYWRCQRPDGTRRCFFAPPPRS